MTGSRHLHTEHADELAEIAAELRMQSGWRTQAACRGMDTDLFFPARGESVAEAKAVCARCPVIDECRASSENERFGLWAGRSERWRRNQRRRAPKDCEICGREFVGRETDRVCGDRCREQYDREYGRAYQRRTRRNGVTLARIDAGHGSAPLAAACKCPACMAWRRDRGRRGMAIRWGEAS